jgi:hypothetical protein
MKLSASYCKLVRLKFETDPRGIGYAFHGAGVEIGQKGAFAKVSITYTYQGLLRFDACQFSFLLILNPHEKSI